MKKNIALPLLVAALSAFALSQTAAADPLTISNVQTSFDPLNCEVTISWDTNKSTDSDVVMWDRVPCPLGPTYPYSENANQGTSHSVTFSVDPPTSAKISYVIESTKGGQTATTDCAHMLSSPCISE
jgi:hypothetical protein